MLAFAVLGVGTVLGGLLGPRVIGAVGARRALAVGFGVRRWRRSRSSRSGRRAGVDRAAARTIFAGGVANLVVIVGFMVTATAALPDAEQGLATGLAR